MGALEEFVESLRAQHITVVRPDPRGRCQVCLQPPTEPTDPLIIFAPEVDPSNGQRITVAVCLTCVVKGLGRLGEMLKAPRGGAGAAAAPEKGGKDMNAIARPGIVGVDDHCDTCGARGVVGVLFDRAPVVLCESCIRKAWEAITIFYDKARGVAHVPDVSGQR